MIKNFVVNIVTIKVIENDNTPKHNFNTPKNNPTTPKDNPFTPKNNPTTPKDNPVNFQPNQCEKCEKILSRSNIYKKHIINCKGKINKLQCQICNEIFTLAPAKYRHQKNCKIKKEEEQKVIIQNIENQNNITNITYNYPVVFNEEEDTYIKPKNIIKKLLKTAQTKNKKDIIKTYIREIFAIKEKQNIVKTNLTNSHSKVHVGEGNWINKLDTEIYPQLTNLFADSVYGFLLDKNFSNKTIMDFLLYMGDNGYINTEDEDLQKCYKNIHKDTRF